MFKPIANKTRDILKKNISFCVTKTNEIEGEDFCLIKIAYLENNDIKYKDIFSCLRSDFGSALVIKDLRLLSNFDESMLHATIGCLLVDLPKRAALQRRTDIYVLTDVALFAEWFVELGYNLGIKLSDNTIRGFGKIENIVQKVEGIMVHE